MFIVVAEEQNLALTADCASLIENESALRKNHRLTHPRILWVNSSLISKFIILFPFLFVALLSMFAI